MNNIITRILPDLWLDKLIAMALRQKRVKAAE